MPCHVDTGRSPLRLLFKVNVSDANAWRKDPIAVPLGPVTRARAKKFKEALNGLIQALHKEAANSVTTEGDDVHKLVQLIQVQFDDGPA